MPPLWLPQEGSGVASASSAALSLSPRGGRAGGLSPPLIASQPLSLSPRSRLAGMQPPAEHLLHGVSRRMEHVVQDGCEFRSQLQSQESRFRALRQQLQEHPHEERGAWEQEVAEIREGLDELQALRREHGRTTASMAGHVHQLAGHLAIHRAAHGSDYLHGASPGSAGGGQSAGDLAQRVGHLEDSVRRLSEWASRFLDSSQCHVGEVVVHEATVEREGLRVREAVASLASRFDAEYAVAIAKVGQVAKEAATARQACESFHSTLGKMKAEVVQSMQELFGNLWRTYSSGLSEKLSETREELIGMVGQIVKAQAFGVGSASLAMKVREESQQLRGEVSRLAAELHSQEVACGGNSASCNVSTLAAELRSQEVFTRSSATPTLTTASAVGSCGLRTRGERRDDQQEVSSLHRDLAALSERVDAELAAWPFRLAEASRQAAAEVVSRASVQRALSRQQPQQRPGESDREGTEESDRTAGGFHALLETLRRDQEADRAAHCRVLGFVEALLRRLAALEISANGLKPMEGGAAVAVFVAAAENEEEDGEDDGEEESPTGRHRPGSSVATTSPLASPSGSPIAKVKRLPSVDEFLLQPS